MYSVSIPAVDLSHLRILAIKNLSPEYAIFVLAQFAAPHVQKLTLGCQNSTPFLIVGVQGITDAGVEEC
jgi:hypothetical protein